jgi:hypothetical protein
MASEGGWGRNEKLEQEERRRKMPNAEWRVTNEVRAFTWAEMEWKRIILISSFDMVHLIHRGSEMRP